MGRDSSQLGHIPNLDRIFVSIMCTSSKFSRPKKQVVNLCIACLNNNLIKPIKYLFGLKVQTNPNHSKFKLLCEHFNFNLNNFPYQLYVLVELVNVIYFIFYFFTSEYLSIYLCSAISVIPPNDELYK